MLNPRPFILRIVVPSVLTLKDRRSQRSNTNLTLRIVVSGVLTLKIVVPDVLTLRFLAPSLRQKNVTDLAACRFDLYYR